MCQVILNCQSSWRSFSLSVFDHLLNYSFCNEFLHNDYEMGNLLFSLHFFERHGNRLLHRNRSQPSRCWRKCPIGETEQVTLWMFLDFLTEFFLHFLWFSCLFHFFWDDKLHDIWIIRENLNKFNKSPSSIFGTIRKWTPSASDCTDPQQKSGAV